MGGLGRSNTTVKAADSGSFFLRLPLKICFLHN